MNPTVMHGLALGLLVSFGMVVGIAIVFATLYRRHLRLLRRSQRWVDPLGPLVGGGRGVPLPLPGRWMAVKTSNTPYLREILQLGDTGSAPWSEALARARERRVFVSPPWQGWTLVIGAALPDPDADIDRLYRFLAHLSREMGEVQFFAAERVLNHHAWAWLRDGRVVRAYAWAGEALWNQGERTLDERLLGLVCREYGETSGDGGLRGGPTEQQNADRVALLARRWSLDPGEASAHFLEVESASRSRRDGDPGAD
ncbi:MAG: hypothetical protein RIT19_835 [Verrucomicrobiota bacterium]|jgi:hypothetical protein